MAEADLKVHNFVARRDGEVMVTTMKVRPFPGFDVSNEGGLGVLTKAAFNPVICCSGAPNFGTIRRDGGRGPLTQGQRSWKRTMDAVMIMPSSASESLSRFTEGISDQFDTNI